MPDRRPPSRQDRGPAVGMTPEPGLYKTRFWTVLRDEHGRSFIAYGPPVPVLIKESIAHDPETGELLDRRPMLRCWIAGEEVDPVPYWPMRRVDDATYRKLLDELPDDPRAPDPKRYPR